MTPALRSTTWASGDPSLDDVFLALTGHAAGPDHDGTPGRDGTPGQDGTTGRTAARAGAPDG
jgi:hypothetical protein